MISIDKKVMKQEYLETMRFNFNVYLMNNLKFNINISLNVYFFELDEFFGYCFCLIILIVTHIISSLFANI